MAMVLLVDDDPRLLTVLRLIIERAGHSVVTALNGREALDLAHENPPDIVVSDLTMPVMDGADLRREMARHPRLLDIPFVLQSGVSTRPADISIAAFLVKPYSPATLLALLDTCTGQMAPDALAPVVRNA